MLNIPALTDHIGFVKSHPEMFLGETTAHPACLLADVASSACLINTNEIVLNRWGRWWYVASAEDWLCGADAVFHSIVPFPEFRRNSFRPEILLTAFACDVLTVSEMGGSVIVGDSDDLPKFLSLAKRNGYARIVAFAMSAEVAPSTKIDPVNES